MSDLTAAELSEAFGYLDELRLSGATNMWGAVVYIERDLAWPREDARTALRLWMNTFSEESVPVRVGKALGE